MEFVFCPTGPVDFEAKTNGGKSNLELRMANLLCCCLWRRDIWRTTLSSSFLTESSYMVGAALETTNAHVLIYDLDQLRDMWTKEEAAFIG